MVNIIHVGIIVPMLVGVAICAPSAGVNRCTDNTYTTDTDDCNVFYQCANGVWYRKQCPENLYFDSNSYVCNYADAVTCDNANSGVDPCDGAPCQQKCTASGRRYTCSCINGHVLEPDGVSCRVATPNVCLTAGCQHFCDVVAGQPKCRCRNGFVLNPDGISCHEENLCSTAGCDQFCTVRGSTAECSCQYGYILDSDRSSCLESPCTSGNCDHTCKVKDGVVQCRCFRNYVLDTDGRTCKRPDPCSIANCEHNCTLVGSTARCSCLKGYTLNADDRTCTDVNECEIRTSGCQQKCDNLDGSFRCSCNTSFILSSDKLSCFADCSSVNCFNGGQCVVGNDQSDCVCPANVQGDACETRLQCQDGNQPCQNGGRCYNSEQGFVCICPFGYKGLYCQTPRKCSDGDIVCQNNGRCEDFPPALCVCPNGFNGPRCQYVTDECGNTCQNGGICKLPEIYAVDDITKTPSCACPKGYGGENCTNKVDCTMPCHSNVGRNGSRDLYFLFPDVTSVQHAYICREGYLQRVHMCPNTMFSPFTLSCMTSDEYNNYKQSLIVAYGLIPAPVPGGGGGGGVAPPPSI